MPEVMLAGLDSILFESPEFPRQRLIAIRPKSPWRQDRAFSMIRRAEKLGGSLNVATPRD